MYFFGSNGARNGARNGAENVAFFVLLLTTCRKIHYHKTWRCEKSLELIHIFNVLNCHDVILLLFGCLLTMYVMWNENNGFFEVNNGNTRHALRTCSLPV